MKVIATRDDVHAGDGPMPLVFDVAHDAAPEAILRRAADRTWLPSFASGHGTWSIASNEILAVLDTGSPDMRFLPFLAERMARADYRADGLHLHFNHHPGFDPELVYRLLWSLRLRA